MSVSAYGFIVKEMEKRHIRVYASLPDFTPRLQALNEEATPEWVDDWQTAAGPLAPAIEEMWEARGSPFFWGVSGKKMKPYFDWLFCDKCGQHKLLPRSDGAPSVRKKCGLAWQCSGVMRRYPEVYEVVLKVPKNTPSKSPKKIASTSPKTTGRKGYSEEVKSEAYHLYDLGNTKSEVCRMLRATVPEAKNVTVATVTLWINNRKVQ